MRYIKQKDTYSCGPIALINAMKWAGFNYTYKDLKRMQRLCKCKYPNGTHWRDMTNAIRDMSKLMTTTRKNWPLILDIIKHLEKDGVVILAYKRDPKHVGHYILITDYDKEKQEFKVVNAGRPCTRTTSKMKKDTLDNIIKHRYMKNRRPHFPAAWFIRFKVMRREAA